jgi:hypothetical protein
VTHPLRDRQVVVRCGTCRRTIAHLELIGGTVWNPQDLINGSADYVDGSDIVTVDCPAAHRHRVNIVRLCRYADRAAGADLPLFVGVARYGLPATAR